jgi:prepilin-type N-terminal cleavage/methylation domain-containing protein
MPKHEKARGFTLIEIIAVLILIAIVSVVVLSRGTSTAEVDLKASAEALRSHIRYVQMRAMNMNCDTTVATCGTTCNAAFGISTTNPYYMFRDCSTDSKVALPGASGDTISLPSMTLNATNAPNNLITFDDWGRPCSDLNGQTPITTADINLTLTYAGQTELIQIKKNTGFVP